MNENFFESDFPANTWNWSTIPKKELGFWIKNKNLAKFIAPIWEKNLHFNTLLDLGTGLGRNARAFAEKGFDVSALDIDRNALQIASKYSFGMDIKYELGDMLNLPYKSDSFHCVFAENILGLTYTNGLYRALDEIHRVLVVDGGVLFTIGSKKDDMFKKSSHKIDDNTILAKSQHGTGSSTFCFIDDSMLNDLLKGFFPLLIEKNKNSYLIVAQKNSKIR
ncbi:MAG TPA: class I SAM-dependent methyltransferase [Alphaproteobacteria bacterium]|nr:class I SAM-dependent methyltransferase [Alphaproteobacteria bacterium]